MEGEQAGRGGRAGAEIWGESPAPGPFRLPKHPLTPCIPAPIPQGGPSSPSFSPSTALRRERAGGMDLGLGAYGSSSSGESSSGSGSSASGAAAEAGEVAEEGQSRPPPHPRPAAPSPGPAAPPPGPSPAGALGGLPSADALLAGAAGALPALPAPFAAGKRPPAAAAGRGRAAKKAKGRAPRLFTPPQVGGRKNVVTEDLEKMGLRAQRKPRAAPR